MSEVQHPQEADFEPTGHTSPGQLLKRERERQGLSLEETAVQLNLRPAVVRGLEADSYEEVPIPAYRRGYLRAYARFMGIDERPVVEAYNLLHGRGDQERKIAPVHTTRPPSRIGAWVFKLVTVLVILGLIGLTLLWWQSREGSDLLGLGLNDPVDVESIDGQPLQADGTAIDTGTADDANTQAESDAAPDGADLPPLPTQDDQLGLVSERDAEAAEAADGAEVIGTNVGSATDQTEQGEPPSEPQAVADEAPTSNGDDAQAESPQQSALPVAEQSGNRIVISFDEQSWTEIFDANDQRILVGLQSADSDITIEGEPPFRLTIGNASSVEINYRGEVVDLARHTGGNNVARFTLGE